MKNETTKPAAALVADLPKPERAIDLDAVGAAYLATARKLDAQRRFEAECPAQYQQNDWSHPGLKASETAIASLLAWDSGSAKGIIATGPTGRGKTRAMWALARRLSVDEGKECKFWYSGEWFAKLQSHLSYGRDDAGAWVTATAMRPIVFIDDLGQEAVTASREEWAQAWFFRFLDIRLGQGLPLFVSTNLSADQIAGTSTNIRGNPLIRRLLDLCNVIKF